MDIKEEPCFLEFCSQNVGELCSIDFLNKVKSETVTNGSECETVKTEIDEDTVVSSFGSENQGEFVLEDSVMGYINISKDSTLEPKIEIKEEQCLVENTPTENLCIYDIEDGEFPTVKSSRLYEEKASRDKSGLFSGENSGNNARFNMAQGGPEFDTNRKYTIKEIDVSEASSVLKSVLSEQHDGGQTVSKPKYNDIVQQNSKQVHDLNKKYCDESVSVRDNMARKYKCDICDRRVTSQYDLKIHKVIHETKKSHQCDVCKKSFTEMTSLKRHKLTHEGIKPHKCDICGKCFTRMEHLKTHTVTHEGIKPHMCDNCGKCFTRMHSLKRHAMTHKGMK